MANKPITCGECKSELAQYDRGGIVREIKGSAVMPGVYIIEVVFKCDTCQKHEKFNGKRAKRHWK